MVIVPATVLRGAARCALTKRGIGRYRDEHGVRRFVYTSTTSLYGFALVPSDRAVWVTEELLPRSRDIYDLTKVAAEQLCEHFAAAAALPVLCLRTSRFWDEEPRLQALYRLSRGLDVRAAAAVARHGPFDFGASRQGYSSRSCREPGFCY